MIKQNINIRQSTLSKLQNLCSSATERSPGSPQISSGSDTSKEQNVEDMEFMDDKVSTAEEQWQKPSPRRLAKKKGKYLNSTSKKLNFNPSMPQKNPQKAKESIATNFEEYERLVCPTFPAKIGNDTEMIQNRCLLFVCVYFNYNHLSYTVSINTPQRTFNRLYLKDRNHTYPNTVNMLVLSFKLYYLRTMLFFFCSTGKRSQDWRTKVFLFRWKNIWDDGFPGKWIKFLQSNTTDSRSLLPRALGLKLSV